MPTSLCTSALQKDMWLTAPHRKEKCRKCGEVAEAKDQEINMHVKNTLSPEAEQRGGEHPATSNQKAPICPSGLTSAFATGPGTRVLAVILT